MKNGAKIKRLGREMSEKKMSAVFRAVIYGVGRAGKLLVFFYSVKGIWLII